MKKIRNSILVLALVMGALLSACTVPLNRVPRSVPPCSSWQGIGRGPHPEIVAAEIISLPPVKPNVPGRVCWLPVYK